MSRQLQVPAGQIIFKQGYPGDFAYVIHSGQVEIYLEQPDGTIQQLALLKAGEMFGEIALTDDAPRSASARAHTDCVLDVLEI